MDRPALRQLDLFAQMVATGSLTRCAADLGLPAGEIADAMAALELRLGYALFDDLAGAARLTAAGRKTAQAMLLLDHADGDAAVSPSLPVPPEPVPAPTPAPGRHTILLAAPAPVFGQLQDKLAAFEAANEDVTIALDLHVQSVADATAALRRDRADIAYFYALGAPADLPSRYGWSEQVTLFAGSVHPLASADLVSRAALADMPVVRLDPRNPAQDVIAAALDRGRAATGPAMLESDDMAAVIDTLRQGRAVFAAFGPLARDLGRMEGMTRLPLDLPLPPIEIRQSVHPRSVDLPAVSALAEFLFL